MYTKEQAETKFDNWHGESFKRIFNLDIKQFARPTGFDSIKFDKVLETPDGISLYANIESKFGIEGLEKFSQLITFGTKVLLEQV